MILKQSGFIATGFPCAEDMDDSAAAQRADAYVIDLNLPVEDGLSLAKRLRRGQSDVVIVNTTARLDINDRIEGYDAGADIYSRNPWRPKNWWLRCAGRWRLEP
jgi:DNA-binding response OmpR family regulator